MMAAVDGRHHDLVHWLLAHGASANARSTAPSRQTALHAAAWNGDLRMVQQLTAAGADRHARDEQYDGTPLDWARTSITVTNNRQCEPVAAYLQRLDDSARASD
jgi:ankyrin repeat protein